MLSEAKHLWLLLQTRSHKQSEILLPQLRDQNDIMRWLIDLTWPLHLASVVVSLALHYSPEIQAGSECG